MSLHYVLDGYNVLNKIFPHEEASLEDSRAALIQLLKIQRPQGSVKNRLTVVFDGQSGLGSGVQTSAVKVVFTQGETADEWIKAMVAGAKNPRNIVVISEDNEIRFFARHCQAKVLTVRDFFKKTFKPCRGSRGVGPKAESEDTRGRVSKSAEYRINAELEKIWIKGS